jgi:hypothetical protein
MKNARDLRVHTWFFLAIYEHISMSRQHVIRLSGRVGIFCVEYIRCSLMLMRRLMETLTARDPL